MMKHLWLILFSGTLLLSCCNRIELTTKERSWCPYQKDQCYIFKNKEGVKDTILVFGEGHGITNNNCNYIEVSNEQVEYMWSSLMLKSETKTALASEFHVSAGNDITRPTVINFLGLKVFEIPQAESHGLTINGTTYKEVYKFTKGLNAKSEDFGYITSFYFAPSYGVVKYEVYTGEIFELSEVLEKETLY